MAIVSLHPVSLYSLWKASERPAPKLVSNTPCFLTTTQSRTSPFHRQSLPSTSSSPLGNSRPNKSSKCRKTTISMTLQMEETDTADDHSAALETPTVVEFTIPPKSLVGFEADYERVSKTWPADLATTTDHAKIEQFVTSTHHLARRWLPQELVSRLENFVFDPTERPAMVIRGLPIDKELPPTEKDAHVKKEGKCVSETWLMGISRIVGQVFIFGFPGSTRPGMGMLVRDIYSTPEQVDDVSAEGSKELLDFHVDYAQLCAAKFPNVLVFMGVRGDRNKEGKTLLCNHRKLYQMLDPKDIEVLRTETLTWDVGMAHFSNHVIKGSETNPQINLFEENISAAGGFDKAVKGSPEARAAYRRVKEIAATLAEGVWLDSGDVLLLNQKKVSHGRSPYHAKYDGNDRWLQRTLVNNGAIWETGVAEWPCRTVQYF
ncbi:unnamed protein product [Calypogeia fissa]